MASLSHAAACTLSASSMGAALRSCSIAAPSLACFGSGIVGLAGIAMRACGCKEAPSGAPVKRSLRAEEAAGLLPCLAQLPRRDATEPG
jgi:hypothetical protein